MATAEAPGTKRRPIRGFVFGLFTGIGITLILIDRAVIALGTLPVIVIPLVVAALYVAYALLAPPRNGAPETPDARSETGVPSVAEEGDPTAGEAGSRVSPDDLRD